MSIEQKQARLSHSLCFMFSGHAGVGKSFCSDIAQKYLNELRYSTIKEPLAYGVKQTAKLMGWDGKKDDKGRRLLQEIGSAGRHYNQDTWVSQTFERVEQHSGYPFDAIFIDDFRFVNELQYVISSMFLYKPIAVRVIAPDRELLVGTPEYNDVSEIELDNKPFDYYLMNRTTDFDIHGQIKHVVDIALRKYTLQ